MSARIWRYSFWYCVNASAIVAPFALSCERWPRKGLPASPRRSGLRSLLLTARYSERDSTGTATHCQHTANTLLTSLPRSSRPLSLLLLTSDSPSLHHAPLRAKAARLHRLRRSTPATPPSSPAQATARDHRTGWGRLRSASARLHRPDPLLRGTLRSMGTRIRMLSPHTQLPHLVDELGLMSSRRPAPTGQHGRAHGPQPRRLPARQRLPAAPPLDPHHLQAPARVRPLCARRLARRPRRQVRRRRHEPRQRRGREERLCRAVQGRARQGRQGRRGHRLCRHVDALPDHLRYVYTTARCQRGPLHRTDVVLSSLHRAGELERQSSKIRHTTYLGAPVFGPPPMAKGPSHSCVRSRPETDAQV